MRKGFLIVLAVVLVAVLAAPAMAGTDINGFYRAKAYMSNFKDVGSATGGNPIILKDAPGNAFVEQRLRLKFSSGEENVKAVAFFEVDYSAWGDAAGMTKNDAIWGTGNTLTGSGNVIGSGGNVSGTGAGRNTGGALGADRVNIETKNIYLWFKLPNTSLDFTVGMQNQSDAYAGLIFGAADMAGVFVNGKFAPVNWTLGWAKLYENATAKADDSTLYIASAKIAPTKDAKVGLNLYYLQDDSQKLTAVTAINPVGNLPTDPTAPFYKRQIWTPGVDFAVNAGPVTVSGFALAQFGKYKKYVSATALSDVDVSGFAGDLRADANLGPGKVFIEGLYISGGDNVTQKFKSVTTLSDFNASPGGNSFFARTDMSILLSNGDDINCNQALVGAAGVPSSSFGSNASGSSSPSNGGRGIWHIAAGYTQKLGDKLTGKVGAGYLAATKLLLTDTAAGGASLGGKKGKAMGTEVNANVNYNIMKGLDFGVYGAYAWLGDFFKYNTPGSALSAQDPDNAYEAHMRLNYAF
jgi:hypothetical protein